MGSVIPTELLRELDPVLKPEGFRRKGSAIIRVAPPLTQSIHFARAQDDKFVVDVEWTHELYTSRKPPGRVLSLKYFVPERGEAAFLLAEWDFVRNAIVEKVLPFLNEFRTVTQIVTAVEEGRLPAEVAYNVGPWWQNVEKGCYYAYLGEAAKARAAFEAVPTPAPGDYWWKHEAHTIAAAKLSELPG